MDSRESILKKYAYNSKQYYIEYSEKYEQEQTALFKIIQDVDRKRQYILDNLLLELQRHQSLLSKIKSGWKCQKGELEYEHTGDDVYKRTFSYYNEAFYLEKKRCIDTLETHFVVASQIFEQFKHMLTTPEFFQFKTPFMESCHENQSKLYVKMLHTCENWRRLLLDEEFNFLVPNFVLGPDEKYTK